MRIPRIAAAAPAALSMLVVFAPAAGAKPHKMNVTCELKQTGPSTTAGKCTGSLGKFKTSGTVVIPKQTFKFKLKGGTISIETAGGALKGELVSGGSWKVTKATGKYKKAKGSSGPYSFNLSNSQTKFTGKISY